MCIYTDTETHTYANTYTHTHIHRYTHKHIHTHTKHNAYTQIHKQNINTHTQNMHINTQTHTHMCIYTDTETHTYANTHIHICIYTDTHTNTYTHTYICTCVLCAKSLQSCPTLFDPMDCSPPGSSVHGILQARIVERVAIASSRGSSCPRDQACASYVSYVAGGFFTSSSTRKAPCTHTHICITQTQHTYMHTHTHTHPQKGSGEARTQVLPLDLRFTLVLLGTDAFNPDVLEVCFENCPRPTMPLQLMWQ